MGLSFQFLNLAKSPDLFKTEGLSLLETLITNYLPIFSPFVFRQGFQILLQKQSGFLKGRSIHNNIRQVIDIIEYRSQIEDDDFLFFLDFYKAFDSMEHSFIFQVLEQLGFGVKFRNLVGGLYQNISSCVILPHGTTPSFSVNVGIPQGCPISPYLFILVTEMMAIYIKNCNDIKKLNVWVLILSSAN